MTRKQKDQVAGDVLLGALLAILGTIVLSVAGCALRAVHRTPDVVSYTDHTHAIAQGLTTQKARTQEIAAGEQTAAGHVNDARSQVKAVNSQRPDPRLDSADGHLVKAAEALDANAGKLADVVASEVRLIALSIDQAVANAGLQKQAVQLAKDKAVALDRADKAEGFIYVHRNDVFGEGTHRFFRGLSWALIITLGVLIIGVGIVGALYGVPKFVSPASGLLGDIIAGAKVVLYHAATAVWAAIPFGHYADEHLNKSGGNARALAAADVNPYASTVAPPAGLTPGAA
jgi:hypothetical protein